jgi:hypothetical protein
MHRTSAMNNPDAPLGHHWQDATHITFGAGTLGLRYKIVKAEASIFTGREPDENRYNFDKPRFDSYSYRISSNPTPSVSLQFSQGFIKSPEALFPGDDVIRTTASVIHVKQRGKNILSTSLVWGMNSSEGMALHSVLAECNYQIKFVSVYSRYEFVQKDAHELQLPDAKNETFNIQAWTLGASKIILSNTICNISIGAQGTLNFVPSDLVTMYGHHPLGAEAFLKFSPPKQAH